MPGVRGPHRKPGEALAWLEAQVGNQGADCLIWPFSFCHPGYGQLRYQGRPTNAHRVMCEWTHGRAPSPSHHAAHSCGNRKCVNPRHISWKTQRENQLDRRKHGTQALGHGVSKITPRQRLEIFRSRESPVVLAKRYGLTESRIRQLRASYLGEQSSQEAK